MEEPNFHPSASRPGACPSARGGGCNMGRLKYDYSKERHIIDALGGQEALKEIKTQVEMLELPACPFCGSEAVVGLGSAYGQLTVAVECSRCHSRTVFSEPSYNYLTGRQTTIHDAVDDVARRWSRREGAA